MGQNHTQCKEKTEQYESVVKRRIEKKKAVKNLPLQQ
jgi:hypothetical protein